MISATEFLNELEFGSTNNRFKKRIEALKSKNFETINIEDGIKEVGKVLKNNGNSFVVHGEPQSGKTEFMIALVCKLLDEPFKFKPMILANLEEKFAEEENLLSSLLTTI